MKVIIEWLTSFGKLYNQALVQFMDHFVMLELVKYFGTEYNLTFDEAISLILSLQ